MATSKPSPTSPRSAKQRQADTVVAEEVSPVETDAGDAAMAQIEELMEVVSRAVEGDYSEEITVTGDDTVGHLAEGLRTVFAEIVAVKDESADHAGQLNAISAAQAVIEFELDGTIITANENFQAALGYSLSEIQGQHHRMFVDPEYANSSEYANFWAELARGVSKSSEFKRVRKDGSEIWISASYNPILGEDGRPYKVVKFATDITETKLNAIEAERIRSMMEESPTNIMFAGPDAIIQYMNPASLNMLRQIEQHLPLRADEVVGKSLDLFHPNPGHIAGILSDPRRLPMKSQIQVGSETIDLLVSPVRDRSGNYMGAMGTWDVVTEKIRIQNEMARVNSMMEQAPSNIMFADTELVVRYMNPASLRTLKTLESFLPVKAEAIVGQCIDIFHKDPAHQRNLLSNPHNLPVRSQIAVGPETLDLSVSAVTDSEGNYMGAMVTWEVITEKLRIENEMARVNSMMEQSPSNIMFADTDLIVQYMNPASLRTLKTLESFLPVKVESIVGQCIDIFHKDPAHQRNLLSNPHNLPVRSQIGVGPETLDLSVSAVTDSEGNYMGAMVTWEVITEKLRIENEMARVNSMMEQSPSNIMFADTDLIVQYMNPASLRTLKRIEEFLPVKADAIVGQCIDIFHKEPSYQRGILANPDNLPISSQIKVGPETLDLLVSPVRDENGDYLGTMLTWDVITEQLAREEALKQKADEEREQAAETQRKVDVVLNIVNSVADGEFNVEFPDLGTDAIGKVSSAMAKAVHSVRDALTEVREISSTVATASTEMSTAAEEISGGAQQQAARLEETASSLEEITTTVRQNSENAQEARSLANSSRDVASDGGQVVGEAVQAMSEINDSSKKIAEIITTIDEIAFQTNLLALNAAVEAARAGEQGRGFAVVASEVRNLAQRSASSAKEIKSLIQDSGKKVEKGTELVNKSGETLTAIVDSVKQVTDIVAEIAAASSEQLTAIQNVNKAMTEIDQVTQVNANQTEEMAGTSGSVLNYARQLNEMVSRFQLD